MNGQDLPTRRKRHVRSALLAGGALALVLGGAVIGDSIDFTRTTPAYAEAVTVQGVEPLSFADVVDKVRPAVVSVRVKSARENVGDSEEEMPFFDLPPGSPMERFFRQFRDSPDGQRPRPRPAINLGSGFFISDDGYVVTNNHVVDKQDSVTVITDDGNEYNATVVGSDDKTDLALLKIDANVKFTYVEFAKDEPRVGDWVVAVGNPFGLGGTVTAGIISARGRQIGAGPYDDFLQIDAAVNRGNSGGPAFNNKGAVVGVNTAIFSTSGGNVGIAFAIPASTAERVLGDLKAGGAVVRGWLGVQIQTISDDIAASLRLDKAEGALVGEVTDGSPAAATGLKVGDAILAVNGETVKDSRDLAMRISGMAPGTIVKVTYWRDAASHDADVTLGTLPSDEQLAAKGGAPESPAPAQVASLDDFGLSLGPTDDNVGVLVTDVDPNGQAAERGLQSGDVILSVGDDAVTNPSEVEKHVADAKADGLKAVLLRIKSGDRTQFVALSFAKS
ncbi:MAG: Do family serine endopeptidase [Bauldia sp.]